MSGLEVVGIVASTFQLAEIGIKLSVKLCSFYRQIKDADHSAQRLASDVSLTCSILHQLGKILEQDSQTKLCSQQAFLTAQEILEECEKIFKQIDEAIEKKDPGSGKSKWERGTRRLTIVILGPDLDVLKSHLDKLKSTMLLMLNVIMYAREINRTSDHSSLECQRQLIETLLWEKAETEARLKRLINVANTRSDCEREGTLSSSILVAQPGMRVCQKSSNGNEIDKYYNLVKSLLNEIDACQTNLQQDRHLRIRDGVVKVHKAELAIFQQSHGEAAVQAFDCPFFKIYNRDLDSSFTSMPNANTPSQKVEPSTKRSTFALKSCHPLERSSLPAPRRASTSSLTLEAAHKISRNHYDYRECSNLKHRDPTGEMFIDQPFTRLRRNSASEADLYETSIRLSVSDLRPVVSSGRARSPSPFPSTSNQSMVPHSSHSSYRGQRRVYSTDYASDTGRLDPRNRSKHHSPRQEYQPYALSGRRRHPAYEVLKKGDDIDSYNAYSYTTPREQFDRDYPVKPYKPTARSSLDRPLGMNVMDEYPQLLPKDRPEQAHRPPTTSWAFGKLGSESRRSSRIGDSHWDKSSTRNTSRTRDASKGRGDHDRAFVALPYESDDGYDSYSDSRHQRHRSSRPHRRSRRRSRYRGQDSGSDALTDDEDLRKYRRKPSAVDHRSRHSSTDTSSAEDRSRRRRGSSQRMLEDGQTNGSRQSPSIDSKEDSRTVVAVEPPTTKEPEVAPKSIIKPPRRSFPEEPNPVREGVAPLKDNHEQGILPGARWTRINRRLVNPEALEVGNERFEERSDYVIVLRVLSKEEIQEYALKTQEIRDACHKEYIDEKRRRMEENQHHGRLDEESSSGDEDESEEQSKLEAPPSPDSRRKSLPVRPRESNNSSTEPERVKMGTEPLKQPKAHSTQDTKRLFTSLPSRASSNSMLETKQDIQDRQQKEYTRGRLWDGDHHHGDIPDGKASGDDDDEKDDENEDESMEADTLPLRHKALDVNNSKREATSSGKEGPRKHVDTLEDLVLSWTVLPRDMIQL